MPDTSQPLLMALQGLQDQFTHLGLETFGAGGSRPKKELAGILRMTPKLLEHTFISKDGQKTNLLVELIRTGKGPLALMVLKEEEEAKKEKRVPYWTLPDAMIRGYKPDPKSPLLNPLELAVKYKAANLAIALIDKGVSIEKISDDGSNIFHIMMACGSPDTVKTMLEYLDKKIPEDRRKALFNEKSDGKTLPVEMMTAPSVLVPFFEHTYLSKPEMEKLADAWIGQREKKIRAKSTIDPEFDRLASEVVSMHEALRKASMDRNISTQLGTHLGEKFINFGRCGAQNGGYSLLKLAMLCDYADGDTKNAWLAKAVPWVSATAQFPYVAAHFLMDKGANPVSQKVLTDTIYAEDIDVVRHALNICKNHPGFLDSPQVSSLRYAITCAFAAKQKRLPIVALLVEKGAKVNEETYYLPMREKIAGGDIDFQKQIITDCQKYRLPYPEGIVKRLEQKWTAEDKKQPPAAGKGPHDPAQILKMRAIIKSQLEQWKKDDKMQKLLKSESNFLSQVTADQSYVGTDIEVNPLSATVADTLRRMAMARA